MRPTRILVIDDLEVNLRAARRALGALGFDVEEALGGVAGLRALTEQRYDLVLLDLDMPDLTGFEVLARARGAWPAAPVVIAWSADDSPARWQRCAEVGFAAFLRKDLGVGDLGERVVARWLAKEVA